MGFQWESMKEHVHPQLTAWTFAPALLCIPTFLWVHFPQEAHPPSVWASDASISALCSRGDAPHWDNCTSTAATGLRGDT